MTKHTFSAQLLEEAADWYDQLDGLSEQSRAAYQSWLAADPQHQQAIDWLDTHFRRHDQALMLALKPASVVVALPRKRRWQPSLAAAALVVLACASLLMLQRPGDSGNPVADFYYSTGAAEQNTQRLADGSQIRVGGSSRINVRMESASRQVTLHEGEAYFDVAPDKERPFLVDAGDIRIRVLGTAFDVDRSRSGVAVEVEHGRVEVSWDGGKALLLAGDALRLRDGGVQQYRSTQVASWRDGWREAGDERLSETIEHLQRYSQRPIHLSHVPGDLHFSGRYSTRDVEGTLGLIAGMFGLTLTIGPDVILLTGVQGEAH